MGRRRRVIYIKQGSYLVARTIILNHEHLYAFNTKQLKKCPHNNINHWMVNAKDVLDFSQDISENIGIDDNADMDNITAWNSSFSVKNTFSLNNDLDYNGLTSNVMSSNFRGVFEGNGNRLMNYKTRVFGNVTDNTTIQNVIVFNNSTSGIFATVSGNSIIRSCIACGTFSSNNLGVFCSNMSGSTLVFENNAVLLSGASRIIGGNVGCMTLQNAQNINRCFVACDSNVYIYGSSQTGLISGNGEYSGSNGVFFNGYLSSKSQVGFLMGAASCTIILESLGGYVCGSGSIISRTNTFTGRIIGLSNQANKIYETYYYGTGDISSVSEIGVNSTNQYGLQLAGGTVFSSTGPTYNNTVLDSDISIGNGMYGDDSSVWVQNNGPSILKNCNHYAVVEDFGKVGDVNGTLQVHATDFCLYPLFVKFSYEDPNIRVSIYDKAYNDVTANVQVKLVPLGTLAYVCDEPITLENSSYYINSSESAFDLLVEPTASISGVNASSITDFSIYQGGILINDFDDYK